MAVIAFQYNEMRIQHELASTWASITQDAACLPDFHLGRSDLLVGFHYPADTTVTTTSRAFTVRFGPRVLVRVRLQPGEFVYAVDGRYPLVAISMDRAPPRIILERPGDSADGVRWVGAAVAGPHARMALLRRTIVYPDMFLATRFGELLMGHTLLWFNRATRAASTTPAGAAKRAMVCVPDLLDATAPQRARARVDRLRQDLMAAAWHPRRMRRWCLSHDDEFAA